IIAYLVFFILLGTIPRLRKEKVLYLISCASVLLSTLGVEWLFKATEQYSYITIRSLIFKLIGLVSMFLLVHTESDYQIYAAITVFASYGSALMNLTQLPKYIDLKPMGGYNLRQHLKPVLILFAYTCATTVYSNLASVMLGFMTTDADVGYYGVSIKLKNILVSIVTALGAVLLPRVSYYYKKGQMDAFWKTIQKSMHVVILMAAPMALYCMIVAAPAIRFLAGDGYAASVIPMIWIMPSLLFIGATYVIGIEVLIPSGKESIVLIASAVAAGIDVIINALLIPSLKSTGAAIGTLVAEAVVFIIQFAYMRKEILPIFKKIKLWKTGLALVIATIPTLLLSGLSLPDFWLLALTALTFFGCYGLSLLLMKDEMIGLVLKKLSTTLKKKLSKGKAT
ncbi:MAG: polysaccharide biosynthesis C-terminal domain-containing protein, partial [Oscillospiraceae bacterium]|nr:polysaccharide biosynthesis C-terminal domain-containing protein [Oscillospiraceae bacterium]